MKNTVKWGIIGPGRIARNFAKGLKYLDDAELVAVGSTSIERAEAFANEFNIKKAYGSYEEFLNDPEIDIVYISTTNQLHKDCALICIKAGKAVLCEKPFTVNAKDAEQVISYARHSKVFLMEAMWTRYLPAIVKLRELLSENIIGEITQVRADFCFRGQNNDGHRLLNLKLGGGALLDVGVYVISFATMILGENPSSIVSIPCIGQTGVDEQFAAILGYDGEKVACLTGAIKTDVPQDAYIYGTEGFIHIPGFWHSKSLILHVSGKQEQKYEFPFEGPGYNYEAAEAMKCIRAGKLESEIMPLDETLAIVNIMDSMRKQWNLKYPFEE